MMKVLKPLVDGIRCEKMVRTVSGYRKVTSNENIVLMRKIHTSRKSGAGKGWGGASTESSQAKQK
jgi:hypothetical protein